MPDVVIYTTSWCPYCRAAKSLFAAKNVAFTEIDVAKDPGLRSEMERLSGRRTVPQIFIDDKHVGGCDDLHALDAGSLNQGCQFFRDLLVDADDHGAFVFDARRRAD